MKKGDWFKYTKKQKKAKRLLDRFFTRWLLTKKDRDEDDMKAEVLLWTGPGGVHIAEIVLKGPGETATYVRAEAMFDPSCQVMAPLFLAAEHWVTQRVYFPMSPQERDIADATKGDLISLCKEYRRCRK